MMTRIFGLLVFLSALLWGGTANAGFGITPPYVRNDSLTRNSQFEQKIILTRSDPVEDLTAEVTVNVPGADSWITVDRGFKFVMPKGATQVPIVVSVNVPRTAKFGSYIGNIRVVIAPASGPAPGTVGISLGAQIDVNLVVLDKKIYDFAIHAVSIDDLEEGRAAWGFFFPGKIKFSMKSETLGNVAYGPTKVVFEIRDSGGVTLLETTENTNRLRRIEPFVVENIVAEMPTRLPAGSYQATFKIYKESDIVRQGALNLSILPYGAMAIRNGYGFFGLRPQEQFIILGGGFTIFAILVVAIAILSRLIRRKAT